MTYPPGYSSIFVERLNEINNNFTYGWLAHLVMSDDAVASVCAGRGAVHIDGVISFRYSDILTDAKGRPAAADRFMWFVVRGALITLYEAFKGDRERYDGVKDEPWFRLVASLRHSLSHGIEGVWHRIFLDGNGELRYKRPFDSKEFVLNASMVGQDILAERFGGMATAAQLFVQAIAFAKARV